MKGLKYIFVKTLAEPLKKQISLLHDQLRIKDEQIKERDSNIKTLTTITESQAKSYRLIEAPVAERKKPWWKLW